MDMDYGIVPDPPNNKYNNHENSNGIYYSSSVLKEDLW